MNNDWQLLGDPAPDALTEARLELHYAVQIVSSVGFTFVPARDDWSHTDMGWSRELNALVSHAPPGGRSYRAALLFPEFRLALLEPSGELILDYALEGRTVEEGYAWLAQAIEARSGQPLGKKLFRPEHELPAHPAGDGAPFPHRSGEAFSELARWFANADAAASAILGAEPNASPLRCWPHHFDIAALIQLDAGRETENPRTIGVGLSPGDGSYEEPYFYVGPWPHPSPAEWPALAGGGSWHTSGYTAAVLPGSRLVTAGSAEAQREQAERFLSSAIAACRELLRADG